MAGHRPLRLSVDLAALRANYRALAAESAGACGAVVKADAYGLGMARVAPELAVAGCRHFFVAHLAEAEALRNLLPDVSIYVLQGVEAGREGRFVEANLVPVLGSQPMLRRWLAAVPAQPFALKVDTGMHRLGVQPEELSTCLEASRAVGASLQWLVSHLACADEPDHPQNKRQLQCFAAALDVVRACYPGVRASLASSGGIKLGAEYHYQLTRPGIALYGGAGDYAPSLPVTGLDLPVMQVKPVPAGGAVGYGAVDCAPYPRVIAVAKGGYADGLPRSLYPAAAGYYRGVRLPLAGRISMDGCAFDITALAPDLRPAEGDMIELIGPHQGVHQLAVDAGTIGYELLTQIGARARHRYLGVSPGE